MISRRSGVIQPAVLAVLLVVVVVVGLGAGYLSYRALHQTVTPTDNANTSVVNTTNTVANTNAAETDVNVTANANANTNSTAIVSGRKTNGTITWITPVKIASRKIFKGSGQYPVDLEVGGNGVSNVNGVNTTAAAYYHVGDVVSGKYSGGDVVMVTAWDEGPVQSPNKYYLIHLGAKIYYLEQESTTKFGTGDNLNHSKLTADTTTTLDDLHYPKTITGPQDDQTLSLPDYIGYNAFFDESQVQAVFTDPTYGTVYTTKGYGLGQKTVLGAISNKFLSYGFYLKAPDSTFRLYQYVPSFMSTQNVPAVTWSDNKKNTTRYDYTDIGGCGSRNYASVMDPSVITAADLQVVGTASNGDEVFGLVNANHTLLKSQYNDSYNPYQGGKVGYATFVADHPLFFWTDPFGRLIKFQNSTYQLQAECGKPVIYLYPKTTTKVNVTLQPQGGFTKTEPAYGTGWHVVAQPNGQLTNLTDGQTYPYLFWEGRGGVYSPPTQGFVVAQADVHSFLVAKLHQLGLNDQESSDFIEFWEPRMQGSPYYVVGFYGNRMMDQLAPLTVAPKPDTVIRVLMDFQPVNHPVSITQQIIHTPARTGFTVVEWGAVLR